MTPEELARIEELEAKTEAGTDTGVLDGVNAFSQGVTLGFGDELAAGVNALWNRGPEQSYTDAYGSLVDSYRKQNQQYDELNPILSPVLKAAGGITSGIASAPAMLGAAPSLLRTTAAGLSEASLAGAGFSEGETAGEVAIDAAMSAPFGLIAPAAQLGGRVWRGALGTKARSSDQIINDALESTGTSPAQLFGRLDELGEGATLSDADDVLKFLGMGTAGQTMKSRAALKTFDDRSLGMADRVLEKIRKVSPSMNRLNKEIKATANARTGKAKQLYQMAHNHSVDLTPELMGMLERPSVARAWKQAQKAAADEGRALPNIFKIVEDAKGNAVKLEAKAVPDMKAWDAIKQGLDDIFERTPLAEGTHTVSQQGRRILNLKNELLGHLDAKNPYYKQARDVWAGDSQLIAAMDKGRKLLRMSTDDVLDITESLGKSEREAMLKGVVSDILEKSGNRQEGPAMFNMLRTTNAQVKLRAIFGDDPKSKEMLGAIMKQIETERVFQGTKNAIKEGSQTQPRQMAANLLEIQGPTNVEAVTTIDGAMRAAKKLLPKSLPKKTFDELAEVLFDPNISPEKLSKILKDAKIPAKKAQDLMSLATGLSTGSAAITE